jgi:hypothetical protein
MENPKLAGNGRNWVFSAISEYRPGQRSILKFLDTSQIPIPHVTPMRNKFERVLRTKRIPRNKLLSNFLILNQKTSFPVPKMSFVIEIPTVGFNAICPVFPMRNKLINSVVSKMEVETL